MRPIVKHAVPVQSDTPKTGFLVTGSEGYSPVFGKRVHLPHKLLYEKFITDCIIMLYY